MINQDVFTRLSVPDNALGEKLPLCVRIDAARQALCSYDKAHVRSDVQLNPEAFDFSGRFDADIDGLRLQCLFVNGGGNSLHVGFAGARSSGKVRYDPDNTRPSFPRWSYYGLYDGCFLGIDDPMYLRHKDLRIGWFYGDRRCCYVDPCVRLVRRICEQKRISDDRVTFFSSSAGGYAALLAAIAMPGTLSISINPQLCLARHTPVILQQFLRCTGIDLKARDPLLRNDIAKKIKLESQSRHVIIVNAESRKDYAHHLRPIASALGARLRYGLTVAKNCLFWVYQAKGAPGPHTSFENRAIYCAIDHIARNFCAEKFDMEANQKLALLVNEYWHDLYECKSKVARSSSQNIVIEDREKILTENVENIRKHIYIPANNNQYNYIKFGNFLPHSQYTISLEQVSVLDGSADGFTIALFDRSTKKIIYCDDLPLASNEKYHLNFSTGENVEDIKFLIYSGIMNKTAGIAISIGKMTVCRKDINEI